jgi:hypothetical protein
MLVASFAVFPVMPAGAGDGMHDLRSGGDNPVTFGVYGDQPYSNDAADFSNSPPNETSHQDASPAFVQGVNSDAMVELVLFAGDIHCGKQPCTLGCHHAIFNSGLASNGR